MEKIYRLGEMEVGEIERTELTMDVGYLKVNGVMFSRPASASIEVEKIGYDEFECLKVKVYSFENEYIASASGDEIVVDYGEETDRMRIVTIVTDRCRRL